MSMNEGLQLHNVPHESTDASIGGLRIVPGSANGLR